MYKRTDISVLRTLAASLDADPATPPRARERLDWLVHFTESGHSVPRTCRHFGISVLTLYRALRRFDPADRATLKDRSRRPHTSPTATPAAVISCVWQYRRRFPHLSRQKLALRLRDKRGISVSASTVTRILRDRPSTPLPGLPAEGEEPSDPHAEANGESAT